MIMKYLDDTDPNWANKVFESMSIVLDYLENIREGFLQAAMEDDCEEDGYEIDDVFEFLDSIKQSLLEFRPEIN